MTKPVLIVGAGPAGLAATHALAQLNQPVVLVDKADRLGGSPILSGYAKLVPSGEWASDAIGGMVDRIKDHPMVTVHTDATVSSFDGDAGNFDARLSGGQQLNVGAAVLCTGFTQKAARQ